MQTLTVILLISLSSVHHRSFYIHRSLLHNTVLYGHFVPMAPAAVARSRLRMRLAYVYVHGGNNNACVERVAMVLVRILSLCSVLLVAKQAFSESGDSAEQLETPLQPERGDQRGIQVRIVVIIIANRNNYYLCSLPVYVHNINIGGQQHPSVRY